MQSGVYSILIQSPTGSGKTLLTAHMLKTAAAKGLSSWFVVHRRELIKQSIRTFAEMSIDHGVVAAGFMEARRQAIQIASIQTLARRYAALKPPKLIVWDECHHIAAGSWAAIFQAFPKAFHIGLTATPERLDGKGLEKWFRVMVTGPSTADLIARGYLAPYKLFAPAGIDTSAIHTRMGDFAANELAEAADKPSITGDAIEHYKKHAAGKRAVVFCVSIKHSKHVVDQFNAAGISAAHVDGETETEERDNTIRRFERGEIKVVSNVELFGEGFDLPALEVAILLRPTQSLGLYLQQVGRALRPFPGKEAAIILDHAGNCQRHGLPCDEREWTLAGRADRKKKNGDPASSVRVCGKCFAAARIGATACSYCGTPFAIKSRQVEEKEGELEQVDPATFKARKVQGSARTFDELVALGKERGYKRPYLWAKHVFNARQARTIARRPS